MSILLSSQLLSLEVENSEANVVDKPSELLAMLRPRTTRTMVVCHSVEISACPRLQSANRTQS